MARYRRRTHTVEAERFVVDQLPWPDGMERDQASGFYYYNDAHGLRFRVKPGNWVVTNEHTGVCLTINPEIFEAMYEPIGE